MKKRSPKTRKPFTAESLEPRRVLDSTVVFNEVMFHPADNAEQLEFVELHNQMAVDMDISRWRIDNGIEYEFPIGTIVPGGEYVVVARDPDALLAATGITSLGPFAGRLSNNGETLELFNQSERRMDVLEFDDGGQWPVAPDGGGTSLSKVDKNSFTDRAENWSSSFVLGGTPGAANFNVNEQPKPNVVLNLIEAEDTWKYHATGQDLGTAWRNVDFDDDAWSEGAARFYAGSARIAGVPTEPAIGVTATASSALPGHTPDAVVNGAGLDDENAHVFVPANGTMWSSNGTFFGLEPDTDPEITFDLGSVASIEEMRFWNFNNADSDTCCLDRGIALADILVAGEDGVFTTLIEDQAFERAPGTNSDFSQLVDFNGVEARFVKIDVDTTNGVANHGDAFNFAGISEVQFLSFPPAGNTEIPLQQTTYFRKEFEFLQAPSRTDLSLNMMVDDGAVIYLNGDEIYRHNMPAGEITFTTDPLFAVGESAESGVILLSGEQLVLGTNVLAVSIHQQSDAIDDMVFALDLTSSTSPVEPFSPESIVIGINELSGAESASFVVELANHGSEAFDLTGVRVNAGDFEHIFAENESIGPGELLFVESNVVPDTNTLVTVSSADGTLQYAAERIRAQGTGRSDLYEGMLTTSELTPGTANRFTLTDDIVINEIMYNHRADVADPGKPPTFTTTRILPFDTEWRYNVEGNDLPADWFQTDFTEWPAGPGLLGVEGSRLPSPGIQTELTAATDNDIINLFFQTSFELTSEQLNGFDAFQYRHVIDDGAIIYLNGNEIERFQMPDGDVDATTRATGSVNNATASDPILLPKELLVAGTNRLSARVHQRSPTSSDIVFGFELAGATQIDDGTPPTAYQEIDEEWIELYNRGSESVDLTGWSIDDAVRFDFPSGTSIAAGEFLLIARDADQLAEKYPDLQAQIVGSYRGTLGNQNDRIVLVDDNENPADLVEYYQDGQWPAGADGRGSSLELRDPNADNSIGLSWQASDEAADSPWNSYTYQGSAASSALGPDGTWQEFVMGMLWDGEVLLDDISVVLDPDGDAIELIQNGSFEQDSIGAEPDKWRLIGNHRHSEVVVDPENPDNKVLRFVATSATEHMHNHGETTLFENGEIHRITDGNTYKISFKGKWVTGSNQLNTRLYFSRLPRTTPIVQQENHGTPGRQNSTFEENIGPTYSGFIHSPAVPDVSENVTVSTSASDNNGIESMALWYRAERGDWTSTPMTLVDDVYAGQIPGQDAGDIVQFYVEGVDSMGNASTFPREGRNSRALFQVEDGKAADTGLHNMRFILSPEDAEHLHATIEVMSNDPMGATFVYNETEIFYDTNIRLSGSQRARPFQPRMSFRTGFNSDQLFRGVHNGVTIDRSESTGFGQREHLYHHGMSHAGGGLPSEYNDLFNIITPRNEHTGGAEAQLARYSDLFLDEQYANGSEGQVYEYELTYFPTTTVDRDPESRKLPQPDSVQGTTIRYLGESNEDYRWAFLNKNNRAEDDYSQFREFTRVFEIRNADDFNAQIGEVIDVDQWLRAYAFSTITGHGDNYGADGSQHNMQMYVRPSDNRVLFFPHDLDAFFDARRTLVGNNDLRKMIRVPEREHMYYGHVHDMIQTTFNVDYMTHWTELYERMLPRQRFSAHLRTLGLRSDFLIGRIESAAARVDFSVQTETPQVDTPSAIISGNGWVNVREIRLAGTSVPLLVNWTDVTTWEAEVPLAQGVNDVTVEAYDFQGNLIGTSSVEIATTAENSLSDIVISELNYDPQEPSAAESAALPGVDSNDFEFVELTNSSGQAVNLLGLTFESGIDYSFPSLVLGSGESIVVAQNQEAFQLRYGDEIRIAGEFTSGRLSNGGERVTLITTTETIADFVYGNQDPWPIRAAGAGGTLELVTDIDSATDYGHYRSWQGSAQIGGSPGTVLQAQNESIVINEILANSDVDAVDFIELANLSAADIDVSGWFLSDSQNRLDKFRIPDNTVIPAGGLLTFDESQFNPNPANQGPTDFALSSNGDQIWLTTADDDGNIAQFVDQVEFRATHTNASLGRIDGHQRLFPMSQVTKNVANTAPAQSDIVFSEILFNAPAPSEAALQIDGSITSDDVEFVEVLNRSSQPVDLSTWRLRGGVDLDFAAEQLLPGETVALVSFDPADTNLLAAFRTQHGVPDSARVLGPYAGQLDNQWEKLQLQATGEDADVNSWALAEEVIYDQTAPWPTTLQSAISRIDAESPANAGDNWQAAAASPGISVGSVGDVNEDGSVDISDVELVCQSLHSDAMSFDLNGDGIADIADFDFLIQTVLGTNHGDSNLDGRFDSNDLVVVFTAGEYEDGIAGNSTWAEGDWNCDQEFSSSDLVRAFEQGAYVSEARRAVVPDINMRFELADSSPSQTTDAGVDAQQPANERAAELAMVVHDAVFEDLDLDDLQSVADEDLDDLGDII